MPLLVAIIAFLLWRALGGKRDYLPFLLTLILFGLSMVVLAISMWPDVIPGRLSIWDAAAPESSQIFMLVGSAILVPMILSYRSEEHTSELQSLMRISYAVFCLKKQK